MNSLKPALLALMAFVLLAAPDARAERWTVTKVNGGPSGYKIVKSETNDPIIGETTHTLTCTDPGSETCSWPNVVGRRPYLIGFAELAIANGLLNGTHTAVINGITCTVTWTATDIDNATIEEVQND